MGHPVRTDDGRLLVAEDWGDPSGIPVLLLHGTPGTRLGTLLPGLAAQHPGFRFLSYDRPGYGESRRAPGRRVADAARDAAAVADAFGVERFAVVGRSGGGPHALACAALLPDRVRAAAVLVGLAPPDAAGLDWYAGMTPFNVQEYGLAYAHLDGRDPGGLERDLAARAVAIRRDPERLLNDLRADLSPHDLPVVEDPRVRAVLLRTYQEALRVSHHGWLDDCLAFVRPWGFDVSSVTTPVLLWHGLDDAFSPVAHTRWPAERIAGAEPVLVPDAGHFAAQLALPDVLRWLDGQGAGR
ncbi:alpha/beta fold hydrolase [Streptomyces sp. TX20-6-3]|uniref:alpha/beta fold hydrolase n=1 Tax=Streptomyces sp. TX20-6-3 TaxID=3028705 RepID=UPI0029AE4CED|nr:alpha/beta fold hydrolase [Streptomyces sp. TX20-6-3]MDX2563269.1 alpha/beta fold hydrolase [Streptomyces sp. TX20-6-3]